MADISIIISTKNEENHLEDCLKSIKDQAYPLDKTEIVIVDNYSTDRTLEIAARYTDKVYTCSPERSAQRNFGVKHAIGKYVLYLDADMILSQNVTSECIEKCESNGFIALYIPVRIIGKGFWIRVRDFEQGFYNATLIDCVRFVKRDKFLEVGGFDESLTGPEDWDFDRRIRSIGRVDIIKAPVYHNEGKFSFNMYLGKKSYYCRSFGRYIKKWGKDDKIVKKQLNPLYRYLAVFFENGKYIKLLRDPIFTIAMYFLKFLLGIVYLIYR